MFVFAAQTVEGFPHIHRAGNESTPARTQTHRPREIRGAWIQMQTGKCNPRAVFLSDTHTHTHTYIHVCAQGNVVCMQPCACEQVRWIKLKGFDDWGILYTHSLIPFTMLVKHVMGTHKATDILYIIEDSVSSGGTTTSYSCRGWTIVMHSGCKYGRTQPIQKYLAEISFEEDNTCANCENKDV